MSIVDIRKAQSVTYDEIKQAVSELDPELAR